MAAGSILSALANLPWGQVVDNAPKLAEGAARLLRAVSRMRKPAAEPSEAAAAVDGEPPSALSHLTMEVAALRDTVTVMQEQMQASSQLLSELTAQNIQLIKRVELQRLRLGWVVGASVALLVLVLAALGYTASLIP